MRGHCERLVARAPANQRQAREGARRDGAQAAPVQRGAGGPNDPQRRRVEGCKEHASGSFHTAVATDPVDRFFEWFNNERPNTALDTSIRETPAQAYRRKMPKPGDDVQRDLEMSGAYA